jgi:rubrerythrin
MSFISKSRMDQESYQDIIKKSIVREIELCSFYRSAADKVKDANLKKMFTELAGEETKHRELLQGLIVPIKKLHFDCDEDKVFEEIRSPNPTIDMKPLDAIFIAIRKELEAMQMYAQLGHRIADADQKKIFTELALIERGHKARLEDIYNSKALPETW